MSAGDMPTFAASNYVSTAYSGDNWGLPLNQNWQTLTAAAALTTPLTKAPARKKAKTFGVVNDDFDDDDEEFNPKLKQTNLETAVTAPARRLVQVIIVDPNENIPLDDCLLHKGEPKLTDATDQELFFELDIKDMLAKHNEKRVQVVDKKVKDRTEYLEAAKVRDLKMVVVNIASF